MIFTYLVLGIITIMILGILIYIPKIMTKQKLLNLIDKNKFFLRFIYFLLITKTYKEFIKNLYKYHKIKDLETWFLYTDKRYYISEAFVWSDTEQGYEYWFIKNNKWNKNYIKSDISNELVKFLIRNEL